MWCLLLLMVILPLLLMVILPLLPLVILLFFGFLRLLVYFVLDFFLVQNFKKIDLKFFKNLPFN